jgi:hypothetical protein
MSIIANVVAMFLLLELWLWGIVISSSYSVGLCRVWELGLFMIMYELRS